MFQIIVALLSFFFFFFFINLDIYFIHFIYFMKKLIVFNK